MRMFLYLIKEPTFFKGQFEYLMNDNLGSSFNNIKNSKLPKYFQLFIESGCYDYYLKRNDFFNYFFYIINEL